MMNIAICLHFYPYEPSGFQAHDIVRRRIEAGRADWGFVVNLTENAIRFVDKERSQR